MDITKDRVVGNYSFYYEATMNNGNWNSIEINIEIGDYCLTEVKFTGVNGGSKLSYLQFSHSVEDKTSDYILSNDICNYQKTYSIKVFEKGKPDVELN